MRLPARSATLAEVAFPFPEHLTVLGTPLRAYILRDVVLVVAFATIIALCGRARFYFPDIPVPVTFQTFGILLTGAALGSRLGLASVLLFYFAGMAGVHVFQGGNNGWDYVATSPTGGYLIGFIAATYVTGFLVERGLDRRDILWAILVGNLVIYVPGLLWLGAKGFVPWEDVISKGMLPFIPGDMVKLMMVGIVVRPAWTLVNLRRR